MKNSLLLAGLSSILFSCASSQNSSTNSIIPKVGNLEFRQVYQPVEGLKVYEYEARKSGMKIYLLPMQKSDTVGLVVAYNVGSRFEVKGRTGLAHLFEHMMFRGTPSFPDPFKTLSSWGDSFNAYTSLDLTLYHELVPKYLFEEAAKFESERMRQLKITPEGFRAERGAVISERKLRTEDSPTGRLEWELYQTAYDQHSYQTGPIGWQEDLNATTFDDALNFYKQFYAPNRATVVVAGDFSSENVLRTLNRYFGDLEKSDWKEPKVPQEKLNRSNRRRVVPMQTESAYMADAVFGLTTSDKGTAAESLMCTLLGEGNIGYLAYELVEKKIARSVNADCSPGVDPQLSTIYAVANAGVSTQKLEAAYEKALTGFEKWLTEDRLEGLKLYYLQGQLESLRSPMTLAQGIGYNATVAGDPLWGFKQMEAIKQVSLADIKAAWAQRKQRAHTRLIIEPSKKNAPFERIKK